MPQNQINPLQPNSLKNGHNEDRFETDSRKIVHRHLENKDDIITDEDIASVRVGIDPAELDPAVKEKLEEEGQVDANTDDAPKPKKMTTPWDMIDPEE